MQTPGKINKSNMLHKKHVNEKSDWLMSNAINPRMAYFSLAAVLNLIEYGQDSD